jgi:DNA-binding NarL/FixJ family response regulator
LKISSLAIVEDDDKIRNYLSEQIRFSLEVERMEAFADGESAVAALSVRPVELALFDVQLPGINGIECIQKLKIIHPSMQIMMLTIYENTETIFAALSAGASSYILKSTPPQKIIEAIGELYNGGAPISSKIARKVIEAFHGKEKSNEAFQLLSRREQEILEHLSQGFRYKEIADKLFISIDTVRSHVSKIYGKLHVNGRIDALKKTGLM